MRRAKQDLKAMRGDDVMRIVQAKSIAVVFTLLILSGCAAAPKETVRVMPDSPLLTDISGGLPREGLWRQNIVLADMNGDGMLDIVTPPPRKPKEGQNRPFIFLWDEKEKKWVEGRFGFPAETYAYGGIAAGDINGDGAMDIALAEHGRGIILFLNNKAGGFAAASLPVKELLKEEFRSRALALSDLNGDGRLDIVAVSEAPFSPNYKPRGILIGLNKGNGEWELRVLPEGGDLYADSVAAGILRGGSARDIAAAFLSSTKESQKLIWLGDGKGDFKNYAGDLFGEGSLAAVPFAVRTGDVDGDGKEEAVFSLAQMGALASKEKGTFAVLSWSGDGFRDISAGLDPEHILAFDLVDRDGRAEIIALTLTGIHIYRYEGEAWREKGHHPFELTDIQNTTDLRAGKNRDGSVLIVIGKGKYDAPDMAKGMNAYLLK